MGLILLLHMNAGAAAEPVVYRGVDNGRALENPSMGWVFHHYDNSIGSYGLPLGPAYCGDDFPGLAVAYLRLPWSDLEPVEGEIRWSILDTVIQRYVAAGRGFAFRFTTFEGGSEYGTPGWVFEAGAGRHQAHVYGNECWEPDYDDPIYLEKLENFLRAAGERYDESPDLAFVDVGTVGLWGEGHPVGKKYDMSMLRQHIDMHRRCFPNALLVANDDWNRHIGHEGDVAPLDYMRSIGGTFRDDSILVYVDPKAYRTDHLAQPFWPDRPVVLEMGHYGHMENTEGLVEQFPRHLTDVEDYRASYVSIHCAPQVLLERQRETVDAISRRMGYRLLPVEIAWERPVAHEQGLAVTSSWINTGVAPCYPGGHVAYWLFDGEGCLHACLVDGDLDVKSLPVDGEMSEPREATMPLPHDLPPGTYELRVSVGRPDGTPVIALPLDGDDRSRRYRLGDLTVE